MNARSTLRNSRSLALAAALALAGASQASVYTWQDDGSAYNWYYGPNWVGGMIPPSATDTELVFSADQDGLTNNDIATYRPGDFVLKNLSLLNRAWTLTGGPLRFSGGGGITASGAASTVSNALVLDGAFEVSTSLALGGVLSGAGALTKTGSGTLTLSGANSYAGGTTISAGILRTAQPNGSFVNNSVLQIANDDARTFAGSITGTGSLDKLGTGTLTLSGSNAYTGGTQTAAGTLRLGSASAIGTGDLVLGAGTLDLNGYSPTIRNLVFNQSSAGEGDIIGTGAILLNRDIVYNSSQISSEKAIRIDNDIVLSSGFHTIFDGLSLSRVTLTGSVSGTGSLLQSNNELYLTGQSTYTGRTLIAGTTFLGVENALPATTSLEILEGLLVLSPSQSAYGLTAGNYSQTVGSLSNDNFASAILMDSATLTVGGLNTDTTYSGALYGDGGKLVKQGTGTLTISGINNYSGGTTVKGGTLRAGSNAALGASDAPLTLAGGTFDPNGIALPIGNLNLGDGVASSVGAILGTGVLGVYGNVAFNGAADRATAPALIAGNLNLSPGTHTFGDNGNRSSGTVDVTLSGVIAREGGINKTGDSVYRLTGANGYTGGTTVSGGRLIVTQPNGNYVDNATLDFETTTDRSLAGGIVSGSGLVVKSGVGTLTLTAPLGNTGGTRIEAGTLKGTAVTVVGNVSSLAGGTLQLDAPRTGVFDGTFSGTGALLKTGVRTLTMANAPSNTGGIRIYGGTLAVDGAGAFGGGLTVDAGTALLNTSGGTLTVGGRSTVQGEVDTVEGSTTFFTGLVSGAGGFGGFGAVEFDGGYSPGNSPAAVTLQGDATFGASNDLTMELGGTTLGTGYDHLTVNGIARLGGGLDVVYYGGFVAVAGQSFDLFDFAQQSGTFVSVSLPTLTSGLSWDTSMLYRNGVVSVQAVPEPASFAALGAGAVGLLRRRRKA